MIIRGTKLEPSKTRAETHMKKKKKLFLFNRNEGHTEVFQFIVGQGKPLDSNQQKKKKNIQFNPNSIILEFARIQKYICNIRFAISDLLIPTKTKILLIKKKKITSLPKIRKPKYFCFFLNKYF